jgi:uncharacterized tellurite resistance protein B-like protein
VIHRIQKFFNERIQSGVKDDRQQGGQAVRLATAALLIEVTRADYRVDPAERRAVVAAVEGMFGLSREETDELVALAEEEVDQSVSLYQFTRLVDREFSQEQKRQVIEMMWRVAFADSNKDHNEEYLVRKVADLLHVPHTAFIRARHDVEAALQQERSRNK